MQNGRPGVPDMGNPAAPARHLVAKAGAGRLDAGGPAAQTSEAKFLNQTAIASIGSLHADAAAGIYDVPEAARYINASAEAQHVYAMSSPKLIRWIRQGLVSPALIGTPGRELLLNFPELISLRVIAALRKAGISLAAIHEAQHWLQTRTGHAHPFATETLWLGRGEIFVDWSERLIATTRHGQMAFDFLRSSVMPVHGLAFDEKTQTACTWTPLDSVLLDPGIQFGAPCIQGTRIPTRTISGMVAAGESRAWVARDFAISMEKVEAACAWDARIGAG